MEPSWQRYMNFLRFIKGDPKKVFEYDSYNEEPSTCTCFITAPCSFCTSLDEDEVDAYCKGGKEGLEAYRRRRENEG